MGQEEQRREKGGVCGGGGYFKEVFEWWVRESVSVWGRDERNLLIRG